MRVGELLHCQVVDVDGQPVGVVHDLRLVADGPRLRGFGPALRVDGLVVGKGALAVRLGYHRHGVRGPYLLGRLFRWLEGRARYVPWTDVAKHEPGRLRLRSRLDELAASTDVG